MKKLILTIIIFTSLAYSEESAIEDIKISCACESKNNWEIEKIPEDIARKFFENYKYLKEKQN